MKIRQGLKSITAVGLIVALSGCGASPTSAGSQATSSMPSTPSSSTTTSAAQSVVITIKDYKFAVPASVAAGTKITVNNQDAVSHTVTSAAAGAFNVKVDAGGSATFTAPTKAGNYPFICMFHGNMMGTLVVI